MKGSPKKNYNNDFKYKANRVSSTNVPKGNVPRGGYRK